MRRSLLPALWNSLKSIFTQLSRNPPVLWSLKFHWLVLKSQPVSPGLGERLEPWTPFFKVIYFDILKLKAFSGFCKMVGAIRNDKHLMISCYQRLSCKNKMYL
jgi:hypothetical protein